MSNKLTEFFSKQLSSIIHFMLFKTILHYTNLELINKLKYTQKFGNAAYDEVVALAQQYVMFGVVYHVTTMLLALILTIVTVTIFVKTLKQVSSRNTDGTQKHFSEAEQTKFIIYMMTSVITAIICVCYMMTNFKETVLVCVAPKIWLLQEVTHMVQAYK
jgi:hypothetical protein